MTTTISVFGLGYVGCVSAACLANEGFDVIGVDVNLTKVGLVARGHATVVEEGLEALVCSMVTAGLATTLACWRDPNVLVHYQQFAVSNPPFGNVTPSVDTIPVRATAFTRTTPDTLADARKAAR